MSDKKEIDDISGVETTGHEWDGIKELNNPLPRWWLWTWYACIAWALVYVILFPAIPLIKGATPGILGYSSRGELAKDVALAAEAKSGSVTKIENMEVAEIFNDGDLTRFAVQGGKSAYKVYCSQCHGAGAEGASGFPNLNDDDWLWGGTIEDIYTTIAHGIRYEADDDTRLSDMPAFGDILETAEIRATADFVASLSGIEHDEAHVDEGKALYEENCAACHGDFGEGIRDVGAPKLNDALWLYGGTVDQIATQIAQPKHGAMPAWQARLGDATVKQLAVYVHSLGGGE
ncbi:cytochrome-c oxidase, cbb3-type subunit III [Maritalea porphyrae]|jgi:cytochrome c oxidase cbb3-type subunit 3|uniref:cytochrome-c oxidase, cbb3-type subunit III n=1 Tax=Maritalea porphyrae TaxID=880732 RepID=UPI0022AF3AA9|nr:cytochrome-c oxidase, cbb3-type subunit III [Maritalea porphyrae]MCZ4272343.1 cytochrome-c oxidase, cbb3-type subunit III [Maritalea porphyrae]